MGNGILALRWQNILSIWIMVIALGFVYALIGQGFKMSGASEQGG